MPFLLGHNLNEDAARGCDPGQRVEVENDSHDERPDPQPGTSRAPISETGTDESVLPSDDLAPVRMEGLPRHVRGVLGRQEHVARAHFFGLTRPAHWAAFSEIVHVFIRKGGRDEGRPDGAGGHGVDPNSVLDEASGEGTRVRQDGAFCRGVIQ